MSQDRDHSPRSDEFLYGRRPVWEAFRAGKRSIHKIWVVPGTSGGVIQEIIDLAKTRGVPIESIKRDHLDRMVRGKGNHQGIAAQVSATTYLELEDFLAKLPADAEALILGLDEIEDPQNVGAILRNAGFFGVSAVIVPRWRSAPVGDTAVRASSGAAEHIAAIRVRNLVDAIEKLKEAGFEVCGADMGGDPIWTYQRNKRQALILGSEGRGLRRLVREHCDKIVGIPAPANVGSLNVGSASAIFLYEFSRRKPA